MVFPSSSEMTSLYIGRSDPTLPRSEGLNSNNDGTERGKGVNVQRRGASCHRSTHLAHMNRLQFPPSSGRASGSAKKQLPAWLVLCGCLQLASCGPAAWTGGVHARLAWSPRGVRVVDVPSGSPAERGGLRAGDQVLRVDGHQVSGLSADEVHKLLAGEVGSIARIEVLRDGAQQTLQIGREPYASNGATQ
jgi:hypothetical protein